MRPCNIFLDGPPCVAIYVLQHLLPRLAKRLITTDGHASEAANRRVQMAAKKTAKKAAKKTAKKAAKKR